MHFVTCLVFVAWYRRVFCVVVDSLVVTVPFASRVRVVSIRIVVISLPPPLNVLERVGIAFLFRLCHFHSLLRS